MWSIRSIKNEKQNKTHTRIHNIFPMLICWMNRLPPNIESHTHAKSNIVYVAYVFTGTHSIKLSGLPEANNQNNINNYTQ